MILRKGYRIRLRTWEELAGICGKDPSICDKIPLYPGFTREMENALDATREVVLEEDWDTERWQAGLARFPDSSIWSLSWVFLDLPRPGTPWNKWRRPRNWRPDGPRGPCRRPSRILWSGPATVVFWKDGTKTVVRCGEGVLFDPVTGYLAAFHEKWSGLSRKDAVRLMGRVEDDKGVEGLAGYLEGYHAALSGRSGHDRLFRRMEQAYAARVRGQAELVLSR